MRFGVSLSYVLFMYGVAFNAMTNCWPANYINSHRKPLIYTLHSTTRARELVRWAI